jgi:hypothetical protein
MIPEHEAPVTAFQDVHETRRRLPPVRRRIELRKFPSFRLRVQKQRPAACAASELEEAPCRPEEEIGASKD